jgi:hypothetical protein
MSFDNFNNLRTTNGFDVLKYAQARYNGTAILRIGLF